MIFDTHTLARGALGLAAVDTAILAGLLLLIQRNAREAATALEDAWHEFETSVRFLFDRLGLTDDKEGDGDGR